MMTGTPEKLKFKKLKARLGLPFWQTVGLLESLWLVTYANAPRGDIGRLTDDEIAVALEWSSDAQTLIDALVETHWLDRYPCACHRLLVHDWPEHCTNSHKGNFAKYRKTFAINAPCDVLRRLPGTVQGRSLEPNQTNPNPTNQPTNGHAEDGGVAGWLAGDSSMLAWGDVAARLCRLGAARWKEAVLVCRDQGCEPGHAMDVIQFGIKHHYGVGAMISRLKISNPTLAVGDGWPPPQQPAEVIAETREHALKKKQGEAAAVEVIRLGRKAGKTEDQIRADLKSQNLEWPA